MPCDPSLNNLNISGPPAPNIIPFGIPFSPPQIPLDFELPEGIPEDLLQLLEDLLSHLPGGPFTPNPHNFAKDVLDAISSLLNQIAPYLGLYRFFQALLNMILCIIDVLCAFKNPFKVIKAVRKLIKKCLPPFLNLFPWLALLAMLLALLRLLIALIKYLLQRLLDIIRQIIRNIILLTEAATLQDEEATLAGARKIAYLLCLMEQLFAILVAFQAIMAIIEALANIQGRRVCESGSGSECCDDEVCPPFIRDNSDPTLEFYSSITGTEGYLLYYPRRDNDATAFPGLILPEIRTEKWQFFDAQLDRTYKFKDIITPINENTFWPDGFTFPSNSSLKRVPYTVDLTVQLDPAEYDHNDVDGYRTFKINDCIVTQRPYIGVKSYDDAIDTVLNNTGTFDLVGGLVYEDDGTTPFIVNGQQATLETFIHLNANIGEANFDDGYEFLGVDYKWKINQAVLLDHSIITAGCVPDIAIETAIVNTVAADISTVLSRIGPLPNIGSTANGGTGTLGCLTQSLSKFRQNISLSTAATFQAEIETCLNDLLDSTTSSYSNVLTEGTSIYTSEIELDTDLQFVSLPITITATLKDPGGTTLSFNVPEESRDDIAEKIVGTVTFGKISDFEYDGYEGFTAKITSIESGTGEVSVSFNEQILSLVIGQDDENVQTSIQPNTLTYTFIGTLATEAEEPVVRRNETDIANTSGD